MALKRKATFQPYDMDTALGTNNSGVLMFGYALEDTDTVSSIISGGDSGGTDAPVFNAQDSVLWNNLRDAFRGEISQMYQQLRTSGAWSAKKIIELAREHQGKWCEAIFNEDENYKHLIPLIDPVTVDEQTGQLIRTDRYLTMLQGSKEEQRKWWVTNRFRYMDSKYVTGDAVNAVISMRVFNSGTLTLKTAIDLYASVRWGGGSAPVLQRVQANIPTQFTYTAATGVTEMETWIYNADLITDVGDLSVFYGNEFDFSRATRLSRLKIGDADANYSNANLKALDVRNSGLLEYIDVRNCPNLAITVNLEGSPRLKEAYFDGTAITGVDLADGGSVEKLHLPATITTLTLINLDKLTEFVCPSLTNVSRLMLSNMDESVLNPMTALQQIKPNAQVYISGMYFEAANATEIEAFLDLLDTMQGVTRERGANGEWMYHDYDTAQVSGTIHTASLTGAQIASFNERYPYLTVTADHTSSVLRYYNGSTLVQEETILDGGDGTYTGTTPTKSQDAQYTYTFAGWSKDDDNTVDADALTNVVADRNVYACFTGTLRKYTVTFVRSSTDGGGTLQTISNVNYGTAITAASAYTGSTPTTSRGSAEDYPFEGWNPASATVTGNTTFTAKFGSPIEVKEITDSWNTIISKINNGTADYKLGNYKPLDLGTEGIVNMQIVGKNTSPLASGSGTATYDWLSMELLATDHRMNPSNNNNAEGTGSIGGWEKCEMRTYLKETIKPLIPETVRNAIKEVTKYSRIFDTSGTAVNDVASTEDVWIPSRHEMFDGTTEYYETKGPRYSKIFPNNASRKKKKVGASSASFWWCRSADNNNNFDGVSSSGNGGGNNATNPRALALGFSI